MIVLTKLVLGFVLTNMHPTTPTNNQVVKASLAVYNETVNENPKKTAALKILQNKCNVCHKKRNPFMIFKQKNMDKRAKRIYKQVFVKKRMPKGDDIKLTLEEYKILEEWLKTNLTI